MKLAYRAYDQSGRESVGTIDAPDAAAATEQLRRKGLYATDVAEPAELPLRTSPSSSTGFGRSRRLKQLAVFARQLCVLVSSGTPLVEALAALERQVKAGPWRQVIVSLRRRVEEGSPLSDAMQAHPEYFDSISCSLVAAGESSGALTQMLDRLAALKQKQLSVRNAIVGAMIYPSLLLFIAASVLSLLLIFVIPRFASLFDVLDVRLPPSTQWLVGVSGVFRSYWWALLGAIVVSAAALRYWLASPAGRRTCDTVVLRLPQVGKIVKSFSTARIARVLGVLMEGRVPVLDALKLARSSVGNSHYGALISKAEDHVSRGEPISEAFSDEELISPSVYEAIRSGERSGQVGPLLMSIADFLDEENEVVVKSLTSIIEPVILVIMGMLVGLVTMSMFMPLFDLTSMMSGGGA